MAKETNQEPGDYPLEVRVCLHKAVECYERNLDLMVRLADRVAQGRAYGNLGNTHYLLGNFRKAITFHEQRLKFAIEFHDRAAERRAYSNLGNCHVFLGEFDTAAEYYKETLQLAQQLNDRAVEAQACYSLGNIYTLIGNLVKALEYHQEHLQIAKELKDRIGESRAYLSISNCHQGKGEFEKALVYAKQHLQIVKEIGDIDGQTLAKRTVDELSSKIGAPTEPPHKLRRLSMEKMDLFRMTPDDKREKRAKRKRNMMGTDEQLNEEEEGSSSSAKSSKEDLVSEANKEDKDSFLDKLREFQAGRMEDQRCQILNKEAANKENSASSLTSAGGSKKSVSRKVLVDNEAAASTSKIQTRSRTSLTGGLPSSGVVRDDLLDLIVGLQSRRMDEQRTTMPQLPGLGTNRNKSSNASEQKSKTAPNRVQMPGDDFFDILARCQSSRLEEQRTRLPEHADTISLASADSTTRLVEKRTGDKTAAVVTRVAKTVPDDDFFSLIMKVQGDRLEDQRTTLQPKTNEARPNRRRTLRKND